MSDSPSTPSAQAATEANANTAVEASKEPQVAPKTYKVKVDGQELSVTEDELLKGYGLEKASRQRMDQATKQMRMAEEFVKQLKQDPFKIISDPKLGLNARELAEQYLLAQLEEEAMDPKDRELRDAKTKLKEIEDRERQAKEDEESKQRELLRTKYQENYTKDIISALENTGLPRSEMTVKRMAFYLGQAVKNGLPLEAKDVVELVREDYVNDQKALFGSMDAESIIKVFGEELVDKVRKHSIKKHEATRKASQHPRELHKSEPKPLKKLTKDEWRAQLKRIKNGG